MGTAINELGFQSANAIFKQIMDHLRVQEENAQDIDVYPPPQPPQTVCQI